MRQPRIHVRIGSALGQLTKPSRLKVHDHAPMTEDYYEHLPLGWKAHRLTLHIDFYAPADDDQIGNAQSLTNRIRNLPNVMGVRFVEGHQPVQRIPKEEP